jgi:hypothetical protein
MINAKDVWVEKFTEFLPTHLLSYDNHTNESFANCSKTLSDLECYCREEKLNFLGIAVPPYNPYGEEYNYAVIFEAFDKDYEIMWHHCSRKFLNQFLRELGCEEL